MEQCDAGLAHAARLLHEEFDGQVGPPAVDAVIGEVQSRFADATVLNFVPLLVRRYAREELIKQLDVIDLRDHVSKPAELAGAD